MSPWKARVVSIIRVKRLRVLKGSRMELNALGCKRLRRLDVRCGESLEAEIKGVEDADQWAVKFLVLFLLDSSFGDFFVCFFSASSFSSLSFYSHLSYSFDSSSSSFL